MKSTSILFTILLFLMSSQTSATSNKAKAFEEIVYQATSIAVAKVVDQQVKQNDGQVETHTTFQLERVIGTLPEKFTVVTPGGHFKKGKLSLASVTAGVPILLLGQTVVLMLNKSEHSSVYFISDYDFGFFHVNQIEQTVRLPQSEGGEMTVTELFNKLKEIKGLND